MCVRCVAYTTQPTTAVLLPAGVSEDSDYTSDVSFPIHHQNSSIHQFDSHLHPYRDRPGRNPSSFDRVSRRFVVVVIGCVQTLQASYEDEEDAYHSSMHPNVTDRRADNHYQYEDHYDGRYGDETGEHYDDQHYEPYDVDYNQSAMSGRDLDYYPDGDGGDVYPDSRATNNEPRPG